MADLAAQFGMDGANAEIEAEEDDTGETVRGHATVGAAVLSRAWSIGKGVAIAGAAITSAPIVIPPLIVLSAIGLALSIPSGIYLASYACTVKLMGALLPLPAVVAAQPEHAAVRGFNGEVEKDLDEEKLEEGEISKGSASRREEEKLVEKEVMAEAAAVAADENKNHHYSLQESMSGAEKLKEEDHENLKSPYTVVLMSPKENDPPSLSQEHLSIVEMELSKAKGSLKSVECSPSSEDICPKKEEEDKNLDITYEDKNSQHSQVEVIVRAEQVGEEPEDSSSSAPKDEEGARMAEPSPNSSYTVVLMVPKREIEEKRNDTQYLSEARREKKTPNPHEAGRGEDFKHAPATADVRPRKDEDDELGSRKKKSSSSSRWACWKSHN